MAREDCPFRWSILDRQTQASLILHGLPDRINKEGVVVGLFRTWMSA